MQVSDDESNQNPGIKEGKNEDRNEEKVENDDEDEDESCIIKIESEEAFVFKHLLEAFHAGLTIVVFAITNKGFFCRNDNSKSADKNAQKLDATLLINLDMPRKSFTKFKIPQALEDDDSAVLHLAVEASILRGATTCILKNDSITFSVNENTPMSLDVRVFNTAKERDIESNVKLLPVEELPACFLNPVQPIEYNLNKPNATGKASEFMKACSASAGKVKSSIINITGQTNGILLSSATSEIGKKIKFGNYVKGKPECYNKNFIFQGVLQIVVKAAPMSKSVRVYCTGVKPLLISFDVGSSGTLDIYLVPK